MSFGMRAGVAAVLLLMAACAREETPASADPAESLAGNPEGAVAASSRPEADRADDPMRKPAEVLSFASVKPGMTIFEMEAGAGYYTELLSLLAGPDGAVVMHSPPSFVYLDEAIETRLADNRLPNVRLSQTPFDELDAEDGSVDMVTWFLGPHELYFTPSDGVSLGDVEETYAEIFRILKPGGVFLILDHAAAPGSPETTGGTLHRIDPAIIKTLTEEAGFRLVDESDILANDEDMYDMSVFDPMVRRKTDRFLLKYKKP